MRQWIKWTVLNTKEKQSWAAALLPEQNMWTVSDSLNEFPEAQVWVEE